MGFSARIRPRKSCGGTRSATRWSRRCSIAVALRFLVRNADVVQIDATENPRFDWSASVRIGREDPFGEHPFLYRVFDFLLLARILDGQPETRIDRARLLASMDYDPVKNPPPPVRTETGADAPEEADPSEDADSPEEADDADPE
jgi:hypothetical protein